MIRRTLYTAYAVYGVRRIRRSPYTAYAEASWGVVQGGGALPGKLFVVFMNMADRPYTDENAFQR